MLLYLCPSNLADGKERTGITTTNFHLHAVCKSYYVTLDIIEFCMNEFGKEIALKKDDHHLTPYDVLVRNPCASNVCKKFLRQFVTNFSNVHQAGGVSDDPRNTKDRLGYDIYAKAIVNVVDKVEFGNKTNFSVGLFAPWGVGKSKLWHLIKQEIKDKEKVNMEDWKRKAGIKKEGADSSALYESFASMVEINHSWLYCCRRNDGGPQATPERVSLINWGSTQNKHGSDDSSDIEIGNATRSSQSESGDWSTDEARENETLAAVMVVTCPIWIPPLIIQSCLRLCTRPWTKLNKISQGQSRADNVSKILVGDYIPFHIRTGNIHFGPIACMKTSTIMLARMFPFKNVGKFFQRSQECFAIQSIKQAPVNHYNFIEFNAWVYNGSDVLWASLMESLWTAVEAELGADTVRLHRASINLARETGNENISHQTRMDKRALAM